MNIGAMKKILRKSQKSVMNKEAKYKVKSFEIVFGLCDLKGKTPEEIVNVGPELRQFKIEIEKI